MDMVTMVNMAMVRTMVKPTVSPMYQNTTHLRPMLDMPLKDMAVTAMDTSMITESLNMVMVMLMVRFFDRKSTVVTQGVQLKISSKSLLLCSWW